MIEGKTKSGFAFHVSEKLGNDFRFVRAYARANGSDAGDQLAGAVELAEVVLGREGVDRLCAHVAEADGTVPTDRVMREVVEIVQAVGEQNGTVKN